MRGLSATSTGAIVGTQSALKMPQNSLGVLRTYRVTLLFSGLVITASLGYNNGYDRYNVVRDNS